MKDFVITISREYGSGGRDIGRRLAELLNVPFYDREIVELTAQKHNLDEVRLNEMEDQSKKPLPFGLGGGFGTFSDTDDRMFLLQSQTILELAQQPCVIVGRCADFILKDHPNRYSFFVYSGIKQRQEQAKRYRAGDAAKETIKMDRRRAGYYKYHTGQEWGKPANYHLCVDSSVLGPRTADALAAFVRLSEQCK